MTAKARNADCKPHRVIKEVSKVKVEEHGKSAVFLNPKREKIHVTRVDQGVVENECSADFAVSKIGVDDVIIELKGKEVVRAFEQIIATAKILRSCRKNASPIAGLIVCTRVPATDSKAMRLKNQFTQQHKAMLKICASNREYSFDEFFGRR